MAHTEFTITLDTVLTDKAAESFTAWLLNMSILCRPINETITAEYAILSPAQHVKIGHDVHCESPLEDSDDFFIVYCKHSRYNLGHKDAQDPYKIDEDTDECELIKDVVAILPLYLYDHSGISISTGSFSCVWDSGQVGWIYCTKESMAAMGIDPETPVEALQKRMEEFIDKTYDPYVQNKCYYFEITDENDDEIESCYGFIGAELEDTGILDNLPAELHNAARAAWEYCNDNP